MLAIANLKTTSSCTTTGKSHKFVVWHEMNLYRLTAPIFYFRYKVGHFITKTHCNQSSVKALGMLVYQCEICAQWFTAIPPLQNHRIQHHSVYDSGMQCKIVRNIIATRHRLSNKQLYSS